MDSVHGENGEIVKGSLLYIVAPLQVLYQRCWEDHQIHARPATSKVWYDMFIPNALKVPTRLEEELRVSTKYSQQLPIQR